MADAVPVKAPVENAHENTRFYGKSSLFVLTNQARKERRKETGMCEMPDRRKEFWVTPDVSPVDAHECPFAKPLSSGCLP